eukprot:TRINITY_DN81440_c0_g1_i1.p1 TRINITY_DN81440_c0_g1~~TRINITY_DN81440_c0_g1_i1.p1  ORF type:complete len:196 (+),score=8.41 TRINITY_DN81440_c0_g1_i1:48-590(+)
MLNQMGYSRWFMSGRRLNTVFASAWADDFDDDDYAEEGTGDSAPSGAGVDAAHRFTTPRSMRESVADRIRRLSRDEPSELQSLLRQVTAELTRGTTRSRAMTGLGRVLTADSRRWMRRNRLNLSQILREFSNDFRVSALLGVIYLHAEAIDSFLLPEHAEQSSGAENDPQMSMTEMYRWQ